MSATGYTPISLYYSTTASATPSAANLANGELAININTADGKLYYKDSAGSVQLLASKAGASGSVTSVAQSFTGGLISVSGSPITTSGTLALTVAGTSGGVVYFSGASTWASSGALTANALMIGGGAGAAPSTTTTGTGVLTALGVNVGTAGAFVVNGGDLGTPSSGTVTNLTGTASININGTVGATTPNTGNFTSVTSTSEVVTGAAGFLTRAAATQDGMEIIGRAGGTSSYKVTQTPTTLSASRTVTWPDANVNFTTGLGVAQGGTGLTSGTSGGVLYFSASGTLASSAALAANAIVLGGGAGVAPATTTTGTGVVTALGVNVGSSGAFVVNGGALGTPSSGTLSSCTVDGTNSVGYRNIPQNSQTSAYVLAATDVGKHISITTGGVTCNASIFSAGDVVSVYNNSGSNQTITQGTSVTLRLNGTATTGNRTLAQYGVATLLCIVGGATPTFVVSGNVT